MDSTQARALVIGAGPAGLMAAERLAAGGLAVTLIERMASPARKFLLAGRGGLNITHSEPLDQFIARYGAAAPRLRPYIEAFPASATRDWCAALGEDTFVGSSGRVFPRSFKTSPLLRAWLKRLAGAGVRLRTRCRFTHFADGAPRFCDEDGAAVDAVDLAADIVVFALGGASWPRLGADGGWVEAFVRAGVPVNPLRPANCGFETRWSPTLIERHAGAPLKNIALAFEERTVRGEAIITREGLEGGAVYALSAPLRDAIEQRGHALLRIDLKPDMQEHALASRLAAPRGRNTLSNHLRKQTGLSPAALALAREPGPFPDDPHALAQRLKSLAVDLLAPRPLARAISTAGGVALTALDDALMVKTMPGVFIAGEMLDWEAPTGGYLLQACLATGAAAADGALRWLHAKRWKKSDRTAEHAHGRR